MQLDVKESTPASDVTDWFHSRIAIMLLLKFYQSHVLWLVAQCRVFWSSDFCPICFLVQWRFVQSETWSSYIQTESDAYEPTVHKHRCAQKEGSSAKNSPDPRLDQFDMISSVWSYFALHECRKSACGQDLHDHFHSLTPDSGCNEAFPCHISTLKLVKLNACFSTYPLVIKCSF